MARIAERIRMTEGQLYTAIIAIGIVLLMSLTGLPTAQRAPSGDTNVPTLGGPATTAAP